ncbi:MAG: hypothetical protein HYS07_05325 [Chlamydiae bacterium]|nr:hypothetical protein [Chlamydiota bacterium]MBI3278008.1 hypothetical protein [Chlamydiota bacterium]
MKIKTSITLSKDLFKMINQMLGEDHNRSELIEQALREYLAHQKQKIQDAKDLEILNKKASHLNEEAKDVLTYQVKM